MAASAPGAAGGGGSGVAIALNGSGTTAVKVAVRIRPLNAKELFTSSSECVRVIPNTAQIIVGADLSSSTAGITTRSFTFDEVYPPSSTQEQVYNTSVAPLVARFVEGYNSTTLAYGQTGSGKTWSMGTVLGNESLPPELQGIVPRAIRDMFQRIDNKKTRNPDGYKCVVSVAFLELYNEDLVDLLNPRPKTAGSSSGGPTIREDAHGNIVWVGVREADVHNPEELMSCLQRGSLCRTTGSTDMNVSSSRSHALFSVILRQQIWTAQTPDRPETQEPNGTAQTVTDINDEDADPQTHSNGYWRHLTSKFHFVDLAGSERLKRTNAEGDRKKEGISINQGLLALGNVISALGDENRKTSHVPYRDSKLTRMLQDSLGGNSQTLMLACISPSDTNYGETVSTLTYANRARNIRNRVVVNQE
ncbi:P-loop containing nucleoside triphosphate hydrolase protein, partial [Zopfochytrium polystomum]